MGGRTIAIALDLRAGFTMSGMLTFPKILGSSSMIVELVAAGAFDASAVKAGPAAEKLKSEVVGLNVGAVALKEPDDCCLLCPNICAAGSGCTGGATDCAPKAGMGCALNENGCDGLNSAPGLNVKAGAATLKRVGALFPG